MNGRMFRWVSFSSSHFPTYIGRCVRRCLTSVRLAFDCAASERASLQYSNIIIPIYRLFLFFIFFFILMITANKRPVIVIGSLGGGREKYNDIIYILYTRIYVYYNNNVQYIGEPRWRCRGGGGLVIKRCIKIIKESFITPEHSWQWMRESTFIECVARNGRHQSQRARVYIYYKTIICAPASAAAPFEYHYTL